MKRLCTSPGCQNLCKDKRQYCEKHSRTMDLIRWKTDDLNRPSSSERGYDKEYREERKKIMNEDTKCCKCGNNADLLHHSIRIKQPDGTYKKNNEYLMPLCNSCHQGIHLKETN